MFLREFLMINGIKLVLNALLILIIIDH